MKKPRWVDNSNRLPGPIKKASDPGPNINIGTRPKKYIAGPKHTSEPIAGVFKTDYLQEKRLPAPGNAGVALLLKVVPYLLEPPPHIWRVRRPDVLLVPVGPCLYRCFRNRQTALDEASHHSVQVPLVSYAHHVPHLAVRGWGCGRKRRDQQTIRMLTQPQQVAKRSLSNSKLHRIQSARSRRLQ